MSGPEDAPASPGPLVRSLPVGPRHVLDTLILGFGVAFLAAGLWLTIGESWLLSQGNRYRAASACAHLAELRSGSNCVGSLSSTVVSTQILVHDSRVTPLVTVLTPPLSTSPITLKVSRPGGTYYTLVKGAREYVRVWAGRIISVCPNQVDPCGGFRTADHPIVIDSQHLAGGLYAAGMGGLLLLVHPPGPLARVLRRRTSWHDEGESGALSQLLRHRSLGTAFLIFLVLQILDIVTSIYDGAAGSFEANPLAQQLIEAYGTVGGFLGIKLPATIALFLAAARLPRRLAFLVMLAGIAVFAYIVLHNVMLYVSGQPRAG